MSAPPLPDIFGNYALKNFAEIVPPDAISWLPQTPGWIVVASILLLLLARWVWRTLNNWWSNRYRREALVKLQQIDTTLRPQELIQEANRLLKLTALVAYPRSQVASLCGHSWVAFLNTQCEQPPFNDDIGLVLASAGYGHPSADALNADELKLACLAWVAGHEGGQHA